MKLCKKISALFFLILLAANLPAQNDNCQITKKFPVRKGTTLRVTNKYGDIRVITGNEDSLLICATVSIVQDDENLVRKSMRLITISADKSKDTIYVSTLYDKQFFSESVRNGRKSFSVDYLIKLPAYMDLNITDEFGNVSVEELSGTLNVRLSQGILSARRLKKGNVKPISSIYADHVKVIIDEVNWMIMTLYNCPSVNIGKAQALMITSSISKIKMEEISSLVADSKSDNYNIQSINNFISESTYSTFEIGILNEQLKSESTYGTLRISELNKGFSNIDIASAQSQVSLSTGQNLSFRADIVATDSSVDFPLEKYPGIIKTEKKYSTTLLGIAGTNRETKSLIRIRSTAGKLVIQ